MDIAPSPGGARSPESPALLRIRYGKPGLAPLFAELRCGPAGARTPSPAVSLASRDTFFVRSELFAGRPVTQPRSYSQAFKNGRR
jgi:hypothetical protein